MSVPEPSYKTMLSTYAKLHVGREEVDALRLEERALDEGGRDDALLAAETAQESVGELGTGVGHAEGSAASAILSFNDLITTELDAVNERLVGLAANLVTVGDLGEQGHNGRAAMATNNRDGGIGGLDASNAGQEAGSTDNIKCGHTEHAAGVVDTGLLERLGDNGDSGVDWVGNDEDVCLWCNACDGGSEVTDNRGVGLDRYRE
jgi:hypothetical protein